MLSLRVGSAKPARPGHWDVLTVVSSRQKVVVTALFVYWPLIFILSHIPLSSVPDWAAQMQLSDKLLHYTGYLVLVFLLWSAINPQKKVNWAGRTAWLILAGAALYGAADEWLQGYVRRNPDIRDFSADMAGTFTALIMLTIMPFWAAATVIAAFITVVSTNLSQANLAGPVPLLNAAVHLVHTHCLREYGCGAYIIICRLSRLAKAGSQRQLRCRWLFCWRVSCFRQPLQDQMS